MGRGARLRVVVAAIAFFAEDGVGGGGGGEGVGLPGEADAGDFDLGFELAGGAVAGEAEVFGWVVVFDGLAGGFPDHFEGHARGRGEGVERRPTRLIDDRDVVHFEGVHVVVGANREAAIGNGDDPVEACGRNGRMKVVDLVGGDRRPPEQSESYVGEGALLSGAGRPVFSLHDAVVGGGTAEGDAIALIVGAHAGESAAAGDASLEVVDVGRLQIGGGWLIVAAVFVKPRDGVGIAAAVGGGGLLGWRKGGCERGADVFLSGLQVEPAPGGKCQREECGGSGFQDVSASVE